MSEGKRMPITLAIVDHKMNLPVISISGREALNAPYRFIIDVVSSDPHLKFEVFEQKAAWLALGPDQGVHGKISSATLLHAGTGLSLYRITLGPTLLDMEQRRQRRVFQDLSVPQIIARLLEEHSIAPATYRFEKLVGIYPSREQCVQQDETDLHLLLRLCEEEGISMRFEHQRTRHLLVFADDPARFPHRSKPAQFQPPALRTRHAPAISYLAEQWALQLAATDHETHLHDPQLKPSKNASDKEAHADKKNASNQRFEASLLSRLPTERQAHERQAGARALERQRCERRVIRGLGTDLPMTPGQIVQVLGHPEARFNDQWLVVEINHTGQQPEVLKGHPPEDVARILDAARSVAAQSGASNGQATGHDEIDSLSQGYHSSFRLLPWEMPFRPGLKHQKPVMSGFQPATLLSRCNQTKEQLMNGRLPIGFTPTPAGCEPAELCARIGISLAQLKALRIGAALIVGHFDGDPERPIIYGVPDEHRVPLNDYPAQGLPTADAVHLNLPQTLHLTTDGVLQLSTADSRFDLTASCIEMTGTPPTLTAQDRSCGRDQPAQHPALSLFDADLRLTEHPGLKGAPLVDRLWYIVRMREPGLQFLARLQPEHFLFEGKTDRHGYCGLSSEELRELAAAYRKTPNELCLVHPGHCIMLQTWFEQNWPRRLHQAFIQHG
ncbi:type VI secretion system tip protein VgrG [Pseudomonas sp. CDFA 553]|uniref:type VI secretion system Vgr family protein n=1 Tax=Pseudomonas quasicaspiana TaxID=2829821 RepID=UPI001E3E67E6|nr:type VI secretion system tip protein TssI/VgrG [Pseudomonas quasicaspiana]MCD5991633.1 type VI secretion system tip protein VgrG [Pseudomonas quasicaspiana]